MSETMGRTGGAAAFLMGGYSSRPRVDFEDVGARQQQLRDALGQLVTGKPPEKGRLSKVGSLPALSAAARPSYGGRDLTQLPNFYSNKDPFSLSPKKGKGKVGGPQQGQLQDLLGQLKGATDPVGGTPSLAVPAQTSGGNTEASPSVAGLFSQLADLNKGKAAPSGAGSLVASRRLSTGLARPQPALEQQRLPTGQVAFGTSGLQQRLSTGKPGQTSSAPDLHSSMQSSSAAAALKAARLPPVNGDRRKFAGVGSLVTGGLGELLGEARRSGAAAPAPQPLSSSALGSILGEAKRTELRSKAGLGSVGSLVTGGLKDCLADAKARGGGL